MNRDTFLEHFDVWAKDLRTEAVLLFDKGVRAERVIPIAQTIADAKAEKRALDRQALGVAGAGPQRTW